MNPLVLMNMHNAFVPNRMSDIATSIPLGLDWAVDKYLATPT